jgi:hypothetical protein
MKINTTTERLDSHRIQSLLNKSMTTKEDLERLLKMLKLNGNVAWSMDFDASKPVQILNTGNSLMGGVHWVAVDNIHKRAFDPFGLPPNQFIPSSYHWDPIDVQNIRYGHCGQYCALWLYYSVRDNIEGFYHIFKHAADIQRDGSQDGASEPESSDDSDTG